MQNEVRHNTVDQVTMSY